MAAVADIGVIGGSGFYEFLTDAEEVRVETPFGEPSEPCSSARWRAAGWRSCPGTAATTGSRRTRSRTAPTCGRCGRSACGASWRRARSARSPRPTAPARWSSPTSWWTGPADGSQTFYDEYAVHVPFADPYCPSGRAHAVDAARKNGWVPASTGTLVVIDGPRFSTRAESQWYAAQGWTLVGMTGHPEAVLARELALCYTTLALVTDTDAGVEEGEGVTQAEVFEVFAKNMSRLRDLVAKIIAAFPAEREDDLCAHALDGIQVPIELPLCRYCL